MDAGNFKILKYNGEGVDPGAFDGTGTGDQPLVISAGKSKDRQVATQKMTLQGSEGELPQEIELRQDFVPLFVDNSLEEKRHVVGYHEEYDIAFSGKSNGQYIRYRFADNDNWESYTNYFNGVIASTDKIDPDTELNYTDTLYGTRFSDSKYTSVDDNFYYGGTSSYEWSMGFSYQGSDEAYDGTSGIVYGFEPGYHYLYIDASDKPFTDDLTSADYVTTVCGVYVDTPAPTVNLHWKRISENVLQYWVTSSVHSGSMDVRVMLNNQVHVCTLVDGATESQKYTTGYTTSAAVNPAILDSTDELITFQSTKITQEAEAPVNSITITGSKFIYGDGVVVASLSPSNTTQRDITWRISSGGSLAIINPDATDSTKCTIRAIDATGGDVTLLAVSKSNSTIIGAINLSVYQSSVGTWNIGGDNHIENVDNKGSYIVSWLNDAEEEAYTWSIGSGSSYASINQEGVVTVKSGANNSRVTIRCSIDSTATYKEFPITVTYVPAEVKFERENIHLSCDYGTFKLPYTYKGITNPIVTVVGNMIMTTDVEDNNNTITFDYATNPEQYKKTATITVTGTRTDGLGEFSQSITIIQDSFAAFLTPYWNLKALETVRADETSLVPVITDQNNIGYEVVSDDDWITPVDSGTSSPNYRLDFSHNTSSSARTGVVRLVDKKTSYKVGSIIKEDWAFMSEPDPSSGIPNGSDLGTNDVAGTSTFNLYRTSRMYTPRSSISSDTFSYENMSPSNDYDATYTVTMLSQPNVMTETKHVIGIYKAYPDTPTDEKTIIQSAYENIEYYNLTVEIADPLFEETEVELLDSNGDVIDVSVSVPNTTGTSNTASFANIKAGSNYQIHINKEGFAEKTISYISIQSDKTIEVSLTATKHRLYANAAFSSNAIVSMPDNQEFDLNIDISKVYLADDTNLSDIIQQTNRAELTAFGLSVFMAPTTNPNRYSFVDFNLTPGFACTVKQVLDKIYPDRTGYVAVWLYFRNLSTTN